MKKFALIYSLFFIPVFNCISQNQGMSNLWYMGYASWAGLPNGNSKIDFISGNPLIALDSVEMENSL